MRILRPSFPNEGGLRKLAFQLALVCVFQFVEGLSDRQAAEAVRSRIDWKYALALDLADPGFDYSILSKFRARLLAAESTRPTTNRLHPCARGYPYPQSARMCWGDAARGAQYPGRYCTGVA